MYADVSLLSGSTVTMARRDLGLQIEETASIDEGELRIY
jgi:hypothetical protein